MLEIKWGPDFALPVMVPPRAPVVVPAPPLFWKSLAPMKIEEGSLEGKLILGFVMPSPEPAASPAPRVATTTVIRGRRRLRLI